MKRKNLIKVLQRECPPLVCWLLFFDAFMIAIFGALAFERNPIAFVPFFAFLLNFLWIFKNA